MRKKLSAFLLAGILFFAGGAESVLAAEAGVNGGNETVREAVSQDFEVSQNAGGLKQSIHVKTDEPKADEIYSEQKARSKGSKAYSTDYDSYSTNYYYNQLNSDEKELWDKLDEICRGYLTGTESLTNRKTYNKNGLSFKYYETRYVSFSNMNVERAWLVTDLFRYSNPQYYFLQLLTPAYTTNNGGLVALTVFDAFGDGYARKNATQNMFNTVNSWMAQIDAQPNDLLKEKMAHDLICTSVVYDPGYEDSGIKENEYNQSAYSTFVDKVTVCAGYSQAMQLLMNRAGIDCGVVTSEDHEWNIIKLNNTWYYVDCTWDDYDGYQGYEVMYGYFNRSKSQYLRADDPNSKHHVTESFWSPYLPYLDAHDSGATFSDYGTINGAVGQLAAPTISVSGGKVTITAQSGANIYYTLNGDDPRDSFTRSIRYTGSFKLSSAGTIRAVATASGYWDSPVAESTVKKVTVKLNANGGYIGKTSVKTKSKSFFAGEAYGKLDTPKRKGGYAFVGWYTKKSGGKLISSTSKVPGNTTLYAHWAKMKPKSTSISKLQSSKSGQMTVTIKKVSTASGYQVKYSLKKNMASAKTRNISTNSTTITGLKKSKTYYVQVRMYQKDSVSGKKQYGAWSKTKSIKVKK
ncbi:MAG: InlB B-repeat-containing protein [Roseburia sp.]|nr:InlB B-repeat-containing protein [Roseburia sp.]